LDLHFPQNSPKKALIGGARSFGAAFFILTGEFDHGRS
jgi:hypothetical protein